MGWPAVDQTDQARELGGDLGLSMGVDQREHDVLQMDRAGDAAGGSCDLPLAHEYNHRSRPDPTLAVDRERQLKTRH